MDNANTKKLIEDLLQVLNVKLDTIDITEEPETAKKIFIIKTPESGLLIGENGETFQALSHLIRRMAGKGLEEAADFSIDVNDYRASMVEKLKLKAGMLANRARDMKSDIEMEPMSSYERLIIHGALSGQTNIKTESIGEGKNRKVVIRYTENSL